ncbi:hypothetical protein NLI96_g9497 [Meripilus lineatus]|uniref:BRCT domain-containing protein n=1 Tax=Meripilus lineatus TaxID=2056292 RepID=A0AAD5UZX7_9APHY|nr:hypothetical protein NLI96_g9497 [Physisporinus lineatus]
MLFADKVARFGPSTDNRPLAAHGGRVATPQTHSTTVDYYFTNESDGPWITSLASRLIVVFHVKWVIESTKSRFLLPVSRFVLNGVHQISTRVSPPKVKRGLEEDDPTEVDGDRPRKRPRHGTPVSDKPKTHASTTGRGRAVSFSSPLPRPDAQCDVSTTSPVPKRARTTSPRFRYEKVPSLDLPNRRRLRTWKALLSHQGQPKGPIVHISVDSALEALSTVEVGQSTQFLPGQVYLGKVFTCSRRSEAV